MTTTMITIAKAIPPAAAPPAMIGKSSLDSKISRFTYLNIQHSFSFVLYHQHKLIFEHNVLKNP